MHCHVNITYQQFFIRPHKIDSMFYLRIFWKSYAHAKKKKQYNLKKMKLDVGKYIFFLVCVFFLGFEQSVGES